MMLFNCKLFVLISSLTVLLVFELRDVDGTSNASLNNDTRELPTYKMPAPANDYKGILMRTAYAIVTLTAVAGLYLVVRAVRARRKSHSQGRKRKGNQVEMEPLALGGDDDDEDMTIYDASKL